MKKLLKINSHFSKMIIILVINFCYITNVSAQITSFIESSTEIEGQLTIGEKEFRTKLLATNMYVSCNNIITEDIESLLENTTLLNFEIPNITSAFQAVEQRKEKELNDYLDFLWTGKIANGNSGTVIIGQKEGLTAGVIQTHDKFYSIIPVKEGVAYLLEHDPLFSSQVACGNATDLSEDSAMTVDPCAEDYNECEALIHALVLITPGSRALFAGINPWVAALFYAIGIESANTAIDNSDIPNKRIAYTIIDFPFPFSPSIDPSDDIDDLAENAEVQALRNTWRADIVVMLTNRGYFDGTHGIVKEIGPIEDDAYAIVETPFIVNRDWAFAHEVGHLFGARHHRTGSGGPNVDDTDICSHAIRFFNAGTLYRTVLGGGGEVLPAGLPVAGNVLYYSNPEVDFNGTSTGTSTSDNARTIRNTGCEVSDFRPTPHFSASLSYCCGDVCADDSYFEIDLNITYPLSGFFGQPPYTYVWGEGVFDESSSGASVYIDVGGGDIYIEVTISSSDGFSYVISRYFHVTPSPCLNGGGANEYNSEEKGLEIANLNVLSSINLSPNPFSSQLDVVFPNAYSGTVECSIIDSKGTVLGSNYQLNPTDRSLDLKELPSGVYFIRLQDENETIVRKILKQ